MLMECIESVRAQTLAPIEHLVGIDYERVGVVTTTNKLAELARGEWIATLADDDLFFPRHLELLFAVSGGVEVVYSEPLVRGEEWAPIGELNGESIIMGRGHPPSTCLIRASLWRQLGGYREIEQPEDGDLWKRIARAGGRISYVPEVTWIYRFHGKNQSRS